ncbi:RHS repeat-associated core domain-containing protein [Actinomadura meridiana]|uniref:RHS repeat-associated core domain-containing protein n=1 Tax=Actinomadura meridiana TaxID=559626 RepID=UPI0031E910B0
MKPGPAARAAWPKPGVAEVAVPSGTSSSLSAQKESRTGAQAGGLPVEILPPGEKRAARAVPAAGRVRVQVLSRQEARNLGVNGLAFTVARTDATEPGRVRLRLNYSKFAQAFGGAYGPRLRLMRVPSCALTTPSDPRCGAAVPVDAVNDGVSRTLTADVEAAPVSRAGASATGAAGQNVTLLVATAGSDSSQGDYKATSLEASATWKGGGNDGDFTWSYPMRVPPVPSGLTPNVEISYSSGSVDGRTANTNGQPSWIGEGFSMWPGYIERRYKACEDDGAPKDEWGNSPGDQCWGYDNATVTWNGKGGELIKASDGTWRTKADDGTKYEKLTGSSNNNGDNDGEYWKVTTTDGTQYFFGLNRAPGWVSGKPETDSTWTAPVFGDDSGEPCHGSSFKDSWCQQAYRWNLDYVVDRSGNAILYTYGQETNHYGRNLTPTDETAYVRGGYLKTISYGLRKDAMFAKAPAQVTFTTSERCIPDANFNCDPSKIGEKPDYWWDVPWDLNCNSGQECKDDHGAVSPTFWSRKRLTNVTTQILKPDGSGYRPVDSWSLNHEWGLADVERDLLLHAIQHTGHAADGTTATLPKVTFNSIQLDNRLDKAGDDILGYVRYRLGAIYDESGGQLDIDYSEPDCTLSDLPTPETNTTRCMPVIWTPPGHEDPITDWFHKYVVTSVIQTDRTGLSPDMTTKYQYLGGSAWHFDDDDGLTKEKNKTWSQWRGYGHVRTLTGSFDDPSTQADAYYLRGMDGDRKNKDGGEKSVTVPDGAGGTLTDHDAFAGFTLRTEQYTAPGGSVHAKTVNTPWRVQTASRARSWGTTTANVVATKTERSWTVNDGGGWLETRTDNTYKDSGPGTGRITAVDDLGDVNDNTDDKCTRTEYADNTGAWMLNFQSRVETVSVACAATPNRPSQVVADARTLYDDGDFGDAPTIGDITRVETLAAYDGTSPTYVTKARTAYDTFGRPTQVTDAANQTTTTAYTDTQGLNTKVTTTTPPATPGNSSTALTTHQEIDPAWGVPVRKVDESNLNLRTDLAYDALGRLTKVWLPNRSKANNQDPNREFQYQVTDGQIVAVITKGITATGMPRLEQIALLDGWLRPRQTQVPGQTGRLISDTFHDERGQVVKTYAPYAAEGDPAPALFGVGTPGNIESQTRTEYDGLGRKTVEKLTQGNGSQPDQELWRTTYAYGGGNRVSVTPPEGGTPTTQISNALGQVVERRQYKAATPTGDYDATGFAYTPSGELASVTDPSGNVFTTTYDLRGRKVKTTDPDKGITTLTYDDLDRVTSTTDARGKKVFTTYDGLGRKTATRADAADGSVLTSFTYDTVLRGKGKLATATRHTPDGNYVSTVRHYDQLGRADVMALTAPASLGPLAGTYVFGTSYDLDGTIRSQGHPGGGGLPAESVLYGYDDLLRPITLTGGTSPTNQTPHIGAVGYTKTNKPNMVEFGTTGKRAWQTFSYEYGTQRLSTAKTLREGINGNDRYATYHYTDSGNITSITDVSRDGTDNQCFTYDHLQRLTDAWTQTTDTCASEPTTALIGGPAPYWQTFTYDTAGNRTKETRHGIAGIADTARTYTYAPTGQGNRLNQVTQTGPTGNRTDTYAYDATGNTTHRTIDASTTNTGQTLQWDTEGELAKVTENGNDETFVYDTDGNRLIRKDPTGTTLYLPDGTELNALSGANTATGTRYYTFAGQTVAMRTSDGTLTYLTGDHQGTAQIAVNATTQQSTIRRTTPFGAVRGFDDDATWPNDKGFVGGTQDPTGLTHLGAREYDPDIGRFISVDPLLDLADDQSFNGYTYAGNGPVTSADPSGLCPPDRCGSGVVNVGHTKPATTGGCGLDCASKHPSPGTGINSSSWRRSHPQKRQPPHLTCNGGLALHTGCSVGSPVPSYNTYKPSHSSTFEKIVGVAVIAVAICVFGGCEAAAVAGETATGACMAWIMACLRLAGIGMAGGTAVTEGYGGPGGTGGTGGGQTGRAALKKLLGCASSFVPGTRVVLADGTTKAIQDVRVGDKVLATDPETGQTSAEPVLATITSKGDKNLVQITVDSDAPIRFRLTGDEPAPASVTGTELTKSGVLIATNNHPFWVAGDINAWVEAADLKPGMWLRTSTGTYVQITATKYRTAHQQRVHNLTIAKVHTYYALADDEPLLVHNSCYSTTAGEAVTFLKPTQKTRNWEQEAALEGLSNDDLLRAIQNPADGDEILVLRDGRQLGGHHRIDELRRRVQDGRIDPDTPITLKWFDPNEHG